MKKFTAFFLALAMAFSLITPAFADTGESGGVRMNVRAEESSHFELPIEYIFSLVNAKRVMNATVLFEVDGTMLDGGDLTFLTADFSAMDREGGPVVWTRKDGDTWQGEFLVMYLGDPDGFTAALETDIFRLSSKARQLGGATLRVTDIRIVALDDTDSAVYVTGEIGDAATTVIALPAQLYSTYDLNKDGVIDERDLAMAQRYYLAAVGDANWAAAQACDFNGDGIVNMLDLIDLFRNFGVAVLPDVPPGAIAMGKLSAMELAPDGSGNVAVSATASNGQAVQLTAQSDDTDVATVSANGGTLTVHAVGLGTATIAVIASAPNCLDVVRRFAVTVSEFIPTDRIYNGIVTAPILMDAGYGAGAVAERSYTQVARAAGDLRQDIAMVTGAIDYRAIQQLFVDDAAAQAARLEGADPDKVPALVTDPEGLEADYAVIVGVIGDSAILQSLIAAGKLDEAAGIADAWEAFVIKEVENPLPGVKKALVIAGSDARGTVYGIYTVSEAIGVSPFYWYSDVPIAVQNKIDVDYAAALVDDGPAVKYRGIFINDEEHAVDWAKVKFPTGKGTPEVNYYRRVFEMMLRTKANTLWPAMHEGSTSFNMALDTDGIPINAKEAAKYGIIMGNSHCEILLRTNTGEWSPWINAHKGEYGGNTAYDFTNNEAALLAYWKERLVTNQGFESIMTIGIRGIHDGAFQAANLSKYPGSNTAQRQVAMMKDVITKQRELIAEVYGEEYVQKIPQVLIPYKEMNDVYNNGLDAFMMWDGSDDFNGDGKIDWRDDNTDVMLMWAEDNQNYLRQVPSPTEAARKGGAGIYYHGSYWGSPRSFLWTNEVQLSVMSEQMHRAYDTGAKDYWILNVGDIKPGELPLEFFMKMGWAPDVYDDTTIESLFLTEQAARDFHVPEETARDIAAVMDDYYQLMGTKKPYFFNISDPADRQFSVTANGDEAMLYLERCNEVVDRLAEVYNALPEENKTAFYQLVYYNAMAMRDAAEEHIYYQKNQLSVSQGRNGSASVYAGLGQAAGKRIDAGVLEYNGQSGNKWTNMMKLTHPGGNYDRIGDAKYASVPNVADGVGAACENQASAGSGTLRFHSLAPDDTRYFDVFNKNSEEEAWVAEASADWIVLSRVSGATSTEQRVLVTVDWAKLSADAEGTISVYNADGAGGKEGPAVATFTVTAVKSAVTFGEHRGFIEANGYVAIEAEHYSQHVVGADGSYWGKVVSNAQHGDTMKTLPSTALHTTAWADTAQLRYAVYFDKAGTYRLTLNRLPTLNEGKDGTVERTMNAAVGVGATTPTVLVGARSTSSGGWSNNVIRQFEPLSCNITVTQGWNEIVVYRSDADFVFDRMVIETVTGAVPVSLLGPVESPNNIAPAQPARVGTLPEAELAAYRCLPGVNMRHGETVTVPVEGLTAAVSASPKVVEVVEAGNGTMTLRALRAGVVSISVTATGGDGTVLVTARPKADAGMGIYQQVDGRIVLDAADAMNGGPYAAKQDSNDGVHHWALVAGAVKVVPDLSDSSGKWTTGTLAALQNVSPCLSYTVNITTAGNYYLFANMSNPDADADSYHVVVDGTFRYTSDTSGTLLGECLWYRRDATINLSAGQHVITIYAREDGVVFNQFALTTNRSASFSGYEPTTGYEVPAPVIVLGDIQDIALVLDSDTASAERTLTASATGGEAVTLEAISKNPAVATAALSGNKLTVTAVAEGATEVVVTAKADGYADVSETVQVTVSPAPTVSEAAYAAGTDGDIVINAVDAVQNTSYAWHSNIDGTGKYSDTFAWVSIIEPGQTQPGIQLTPIADADNKREWTGANEMRSPSISYKIFVPEAGNYYLSFFSNSPNVNSDSFHFAVNGVYQFVSKDVITTGSDGYGGAHGEGWFGCDKKAFPLKAGLNTISFFGRESGTLFRQIVVSKTKPAAGNLPGLAWRNPSPVVTPE